MPGMLLSTLPVLSHLLLIAILWNKNCSSSFYTWSSREREVKSLNWGLPTSTCAARIQSQFTARQSSWGTQAGSPALYFPPLVFPVCLVQCLTLGPAQLSFVTWINEKALNDVKQKLEISPLPPPTPSFYMVPLTKGSHWLSVSYAFLQKMFSGTYLHSYGFKTWIHAIHIALHLLLSLICFGGLSKAAPMSTCLPHFVLLVFPFMGFSVETHQYGCAWVVYSLCPF